MSAFGYYELPRVLAPGQRLVLHKRKGILTLVAQEESGTQFIEQALLTYEESKFVQALLEVHPDYVPNEVLLAAYNNLAVEDGRELLIQAHESGGVSGLMSPTRGLLSRIRLKIRPLGIAIQSLIHTGYCLLPVHAVGYSRHDSSSREDEKFMQKRRV
jgi:hypothetical protein